MNKLTLRTAALLAVGALIAMAAGLLLGPHWGWGFFSSVVLALLAYHLRHLALLSRWVSGPATEPVPESSGIWDEVFSRLYRRQRWEIRQRRRFARLLARSQQAGRALPYGVTILGPEMQIVWCNDSAETHFSISRESDIGQPITNLVRQPDFANYINGADFAEPLEISTARQEELILSIQMVPYVESHHLLLSRDVTQAHKLSVMRRDFVANVSHELKSPLTVVAGFLETLTDSEVKLDERRRQGYLEMMRDHTRRMQRLVEDLLTLSALESGRGLNEETLVDVSVLLAGVRDEALALSAGRHRIELNAEDRVLLLANAQELRSAFGNLVSNAVHYTPAGGDIRLSWGRRGTQAVFSVADSGPGIEPRHIPRLTERFYRVDHSRSRETGGTGLGLAIVKHVLTRHQATLEIESEPGRGSCFSAVFPARRVKSAADAAPVADLTQSGKAA